MKNLNLDDDKIQAALWQKVRGELSCSSHDISHVERVVSLCKRIAQTETDVNLAVLIYAAILHDIARVKEDHDITRKIDHAVLGEEMSRAILQDIGISSVVIEHICACIRTHRYRSNDAPESKEAKILFDADKIDGLGATGVARAFMVAGENSEPLYSNVDIEQYINENIAENNKIINLKLHSPNLEFEIKLKHVPNRMFTDTGKRLARQRLIIMQSFFIQLKQEQAFIH